MALVISFYLLFFSINSYAFDILRVSKDKKSFIELEVASGLVSVHCSPMDKHDKDNFTYLYVRGSEKIYEFLFRRPWSNESCQWKKREIQKVLKSGKKIVILGDMTELGRFSQVEHQNIGKQVSMFADELYIVGPKAEDIGGVAQEAGMDKSKVHFFESANFCAEHVRNISKRGDLILVKGSQSMRMERVVEALMAEPSKAGELLVRQEKEWKER